VVVALSTIFAVAFAFVTVELPRWLARVAKAVVDIPDYHPELEPEAIEEFLNTSLVRPIGYACLALVVVVTVVGLIVGRTGWSKAGALILILPTFGYFAGSMFFLAGLGVLRALWLPMWSGSLALGDVAYLPYMALVWPLWQLGFDVRHEVAIGAVLLGLLLFALSTATWLVNRRLPVVESGPYRYSRHPQYLGWIVWSWGLMLLAGLEPVPFGGENPGAGLPWVISTLVIIAVAWIEESRMLKDHPTAYPPYRNRTPFLFPFPRRLGNVLLAPMRRALGKEAPETNGEALLAAVVYLVLAMAASLPFVFFDWPPMEWWGWPV
jgi:protein-S-isoprenylcysteine O-methyltransferase Ste14